jgi:hypothetical protein
MALGVALLVPVFLLIGSKLASSSFASSLWLFTIASGLPLPFLLGILAVALILSISLFLKQQVREFLGRSSRNLTVYGILVGIIALLIGWNQSTLFGGANILIGQIRQLPLLPFEWTWQIEHLYIALTRFAVSMGMKDDQSSYLIIRLTSILFSLLAIPALAGVVCRYLSNATARIAAMSLLLIPILPFLVGLPLREAVLIPVIAWTCFFALREKQTFVDTLLMLVILLIGAWLHPWALFLAPALVTSLFPKKEIIRYTAGFLLLIAGVAFVVFSRSSSIALDRSLQAFMPPTALGADWIFGSAHLLTLLQILLIAVSGFLLLFIGRSKQSKKHADFSILIIATAASLVLLVMLRFQQTVVLDWSRLLPLLLPFSFLAALKIPEIKPVPTNRTTVNMVIPPFLLIASLLWVLPLSKTPVGEDFVTHMAEVDEPRWVAVGFGLRDAYFLEKEFQEATYWENQLTTRSTDYLTWRGCYDLIGVGNLNDGILELHQVLVNQPDWADPRAMLALAYSRTNSPEPARAHLDTVLSFYRFDQQLLISRYNVEMQANQILSADSLIRRARVLYPKNKTIKTDQMITAGRLGRVGESVARADSLLQENPTFAAALRVRGMAAERSGNLQEAITWYQKYIESETDMSQVAAIRSKISQLTGMLPDSASGQ